MPFENPYALGDGAWIRGNLHAHSTESDGEQAPQAVVNGYAARGYGFLMLSDHDKLTDPGALDACGMTLLPGNEISAQGPHLLHVGAHMRIEPDSDRQKVLDAIAEDGGFAVFNHPNWREDFNHCPQEILETHRPYLGIEIYNGVIRRLAGAPLATDRWDRLLGNGHRVWGFANDDSHRADDVALAWNVVRSKDTSAASILDAFRNGSFYASTGVEIERIAVTGDTIEVVAPGASRVLAVADFGKRVGEADGATIRFERPADDSLSYVRIECHGAGEAQAWTQPFFVMR